MPKVEIKPVAKVFAKALGIRSSDLHVGCEVSAQDKVTIAVNGSNRQGSFDITLKPNMPTPQASICFIKAHQEGQGDGPRLVAQLENAARDCGAQVMQVSGSLRTKAGFWESQGYQSTGRGPITHQKEL